mgnify:CR=1 FL=1
MREMPWAVHRDTRLLGVIAIQASGGNADVAAILAGQSRISFPNPLTNPVL